MVYITGDMHGDASRFSLPEMKKLGSGDTLIVCGDFGFIWDDSKKEKKTLKKLSKKKYNICFIDGTHENFSILNKYEVSEWNGGKVHQIEKNIFHLMRGQIFEIDGISIFAMGGGESPDIELRFNSDNWSRDEIPSRAELIEGADNLQKRDCRVDVVVTHEPPSKIKRFLKMKDETGRQVRITSVNAYLEELNNSCEFTKWFFGSLHMDKYISSTHIAVFTGVVDCLTGKRLRDK